MLDYRYMKFSSQAKIALAIGIAGLGLAFAAASGVPGSSRYLVREIAAPDHVWYVDRDGGARFFMGSDAQAEAVIGRFARGVSDQDLAKIPQWPFQAAPGDAGFDAWRGRFLRDPKGAFWYVHDLAGRRVRLPSRGIVKALISMSKEYSRTDLKTIPVSGDSPDWLTVPAGYEADIIAGTLDHPRVLGWDPAGRLVFSELTERGKIIALEPDGEGGFRRRVILDGTKQGLTNLFNAHGFAFLGGRLYVASEYMLESWAYDPKTGTVQGDSRKVIDLPPNASVFPGQGHNTRTVVAGRDGKLYLSIGSSCNGCYDLDPDAFAMIKQIDPASGKVETFATGLRNTVFFLESAKEPGVLVGNDMGRDDLGEDIPPDEFNIIRKGLVYGWPGCYGDRTPAPDDKTPETCASTEPPAYAYDAHAAPLGLRYIPASFKQDWTGDLLVAQHGSVVRKNSVAGYKIIRLKLDASGKPIGQEDAITGFLRGENVPAGRPVDLLFAPDGTLYITDDHAGVIHRVRKVS